MVIGDLNSWKCRILRVDGESDSYEDTNVAFSEVKSALLVSRMLKGLRGNRTWNGVVDFYSCPLGLLTCGLPPATCVTYIEDKLQELCNKSYMLSVTAAQDSSRRIENVASTLGYGPVITCFGGQA